MEGKPWYRRAGLYVGAAALVAIGLGAAYKRDVKAFIWEQVRHADKPVSGWNYIVLGPEEKAPYGSIKMPDGVSWVPQKGQTMWDFVRYRFVLTRHADIAEKIREIEKLNPEYKRLQKDTRYVDWQGRLKKGADGIAGDDIVAVRYKK